MRARKLMAMMTVIITLACGTAACGDDDDTSAAPHTSEDAGSDAGADTGTGCTEPDPTGCTDDDQCPGDQFCARGEDVCQPSSCICSEEGVWFCSEDCGGGECRDPEARCEEPNPAGCQDHEACASNELCVPDEAQCTPTECVCTEEGEWFCNRDCSGKVCKPADEACQGPNPEGCTQNSDCGAADLRCDIDDEVCIPTGCSCQGGEWVCDEECGGGVCERVLNGISCDLFENPQGCTPGSCSAGKECVIDPEVCISSYCVCTELGEWACVDDCAGGECRDI
ncbi:hypothetical protein DV096_13965 [Bradymonadaceae bacterium TMQ3]|uniref:Tryptophan synthase alpha chain n=1 Tax=Lujinxingia sediminis TaxID=2480984 RepID=A0ABY0CTQ8_9DELT|nr:hypothetical protein [Lujinxingia sediminis]RDV37605.1 hypothetical protein DV096_13965 [Bradymonadaceae bacterium TMQ3]RVU45712.1 hypothetical protein EA187_08065 [Lujinxingia sediminis]TXC75157.1 hypothetical protein FRC91_13835 [Bradymonadales bacterium TMQ1]